METNRLRLPWLVLLSFIVIFVLIGCTPDSAHPVETMPTSSMSVATTITPAEDTTFSEEEAVVRAPIKDIRVTSSDEAVKTLVSKWLEGYKNTSVPDAVEDYLIEKITVMPVTQEWKDFCVIARVSFSIKTENYAGNLWPSIGTGEDNPPWYPEWMTFGIKCKQTEISLYLLPGWGT